MGPCLCGDPACQWFGNGLTDDALTGPEAKALIAAARRVVATSADYLNAFDRRPLRDAVANLATVLGHVTRD